MQQQRSDDVSIMGRSFDSDASGMGSSCSTSSLAWTFRPSFPRPLPSPPQGSSGMLMEQKKNFHDLFC